MSYSARWAGFGLSALALAAASSTSFSNPLNSPLPETVVTAARFETSAQDTLAEVHVITQEQIQSIAPGRSLAEVLQRFAGVQLSSYGARGQTQSVFVRGANSGHTLFLVDGVRYGSASSGGATLENLPLELIERIEVVKGALSSLYGSDAVGGVVQIFTKRGRGSGQAAVAQTQLSLGEYGHKSASLNLFGEQKGWDYQLSASRVQERGISASGEHSGEFTYHPDRDGFQQTAFNFALGYEINPDWRVDAVLLGSKGRSYMDDGAAGSNPYNDLRSNAGKLTVRGAILENWISSFSIGRSSDKIDNLQAAWGDSLYHTTQTSYNWENQIETPLGTLLAGLERLEQKVSTSDAYSVNKRSIDSGFAGLSGNAGVHHWQASLRRDRNSQFGSFTTYGLSYGLDIGSGLRLLAAHGKSLRAPTFNDLYGNWFAPYTGNPDLVPERGKNYEAGLQWQHTSESGGNHSAKLLRFENRIDQLIQPGAQQMENVLGRTRLRGWSLSYGMSSGGWSVQAALETLNVNQANDVPILRRAKQQWSVNVQKEIGSWQIGTSVLHVGSRRDTDFASYPSAPVRLGAYTVVDASLGYRITPSLEAHLRIANLGNKRYETAYGYPQLGRAAYATLRWTMK